MVHYDVITVGSATRDTFLISRDFAARLLDDQPVVVLPASAKLDVVDIANDTGGGATNAAVCFARVGLKVGCMAKIGVDSSGREVEHSLEKEGVENLLVKDKTHQTGISVVLKGPDGEDTILTHRGAGYEYSSRDFTMTGKTANWLYITSLGGDIALLSRLVKWANLEGIKVAVNPGRREIDKGTKLRRILKQVDVVIMNRAEAMRLFRSEEPRDCLRSGRESGWHTIIMTDAGQGSWVLDGSYIYRAGVYKDTKVIDRTGAGHAFGAGFISAIAKGKSLEQAISFASANATSVISYIGAKTGILRSVNADIMKIDISVFENREEFHDASH